MAWISPIVGDLDGALREASASLEEFRREADPIQVAELQPTNAFELV